MRWPYDSVRRSCWKGWRCVGRFGAALALIAIGHAGGMGSEPEGDFSQWRCPERDGVNCLYLQLRLLGYAGSYEQVVEAVPGGAEHASLAGLAEAAKRLGFVLVPTKLSISELTRLRSPVITLFEEAELGRGRFHFVIGFSQTKAHLIDGNFITRYEMPIDQFRRVWTGFAVIPQPASPWPRRALGTAIGAMLVCLATWLAHLVVRKTPRWAITTLGSHIPRKSESI